MNLNFNNISNLKNVYSLDNKSNIYSYIKNGKSLLINKLEHNNTYTKHLLEIKETNYVYDYCFSNNTIEDSLDYDNVNNNQCIIDSLFFLCSKDNPIRLYNINYNDLNDNLNYTHISNYSIKNDLSIVDPTFCLTYDDFNLYLYSGLRDNSIMISDIVNEYSYKRNISKAINKNSIICSIIAPSSRHVLHNNIITSSFDNSLSILDKKILSCQEFFIKNNELDNSSNLINTTKDIQNSAHSILEYETNKLIINNRNSNYISIYDVRNFKNLLDNIKIPRLSNTYSKLDLDISENLMIFKQSNNTAVVYDLKNMTKKVEIDINSLFKISVNLNNENIFYKCCFIDNKKVLFNLNINNTHNLNSILLLN